MKLIFITGSASCARAMALAGVDRIMVDLEINGKEERQSRRNTVISRHTLQDVSAVRTALDNCGEGELMVRINPLFSSSKSEINEVILRGAERIMLPMFTHPDEVSLCLDYIDGRVPLTLLLETSAALVRLPRILNIVGFDDIHIGLNDLHIDMRLDCMFELFCSGLLDHAARLIRDVGIPFGIGGVACVGSGAIPAELILAAHMHMGSERVILSRAFVQSLERGCSADTEICKIRSFVSRGDLDLLALRAQLSRKVDLFSDAIRSAALVD